MNMKKYIAALFGAIALVASGCSDYDSDIKNLEQRIDEIESNQIKSIESQIKNINESLPKLEQTDKDLKGMITALEGTADDLAKSLADNSKSISDVKSDLEKAVKDLQSSDKKNKEELIAAINTAKGEVLANLESAKTEIEGKLTTINKTIADLQKKDAELEKKISDLKEYVDKEIKGTKDWATATFATLTQYNGIVEQVAGINSEISGLKESLKDLETRLTDKFSEDLKKAVTDLEDKIADEVSGLNERIDKEVADITAAYTAAISTAGDELEKAWAANLKTSIDDLEKSMKSWVNEKLTAYWTIEETKAALEAQKTDLETQLEAQKVLLKGLIDANTGDITKLKEALAETEKNIEANTKAISDLRADLEKAEADITEAYTKAIEDAISALEGRLDAKLANEIKAVNDRINEIVRDWESRIKSCEDQVKDAIDKMNEALKEMGSKIQSVTYRPEYSDGVHNVYREDKAFLMRFEIHPAAVVSKLSTTNVKMQAYVDRGNDPLRTRDLAIIGIVQESNGVIAVKASAENIKWDTPTIESFFDATWKYPTYAKLLIEDSTQGWEISSAFVPLKVVDGSLDPKKEINGHEYVEMGDGLKWATCNIGASTPEEVGLRFAWGETATKSEYYRDNYKWYENENYTKYNFDDGKTVLESSDDAATVNWGGSWRTPTNEEFAKLLNNENFEWKYDDAKKGMSVTSKISGYEGNSIFFKSKESYWSSTRWGEKNAYILYVGTSINAQDGDITKVDLAEWRYYGIKVRPVSN